MRLFPTSGATARAVSPQGKSLETPDPQRRRSFPWQPFLIGGLAFLLLTGGAIIRPGNLHWLMRGDPATYLLGWMFFRNTPILQQPFGANWPYGMEMSSSIVYPDGIPLMALLLKPVEALLPEHFQYFGIWTLICYVLQSFFAWKLLGRITNLVWHKVFATLFFVLAPPFVWRLYPHFALGSHWLLLASLYLYSLPQFRSRSWILLVVIASLINPYLLAMTILLFGAALAKHCANGELGVTDGLKSFALTMAILLFVMWEAGYFMVSTVGSSGFGFYRASLPGFIDPGTGIGAGSSWSHFLKDQPKAWGNYEGFCFLGTGTILLGVVALGEMLRLGVGALKWKRLWPLFLVFCFTLLFALSNNIAIGPYVIFHYDVPPILERFTNALRASGRVIWPAYYMLITGILAMVFRGLAARPALALVSFCALVQVADSWEALRAVRNGYHVKFDNRSGNHPTLLSSSFWKRAAEKYKRIECILPIDQAEPNEQPENYFPLCYFAATHHISINTAYLARVDENKFKTMRTNLLQLIEHGQLDSQALYVFQNSALWGSGVLRMTNGDWAGVVDGFKIIAPSWDGETRQDTLSTLRQTIPEYHFGAQPLFVAGAEGTRYLGDGWSQPETWVDRSGVWSDGDSASIILLLDCEPTSDAFLQLDGVGFVSAKCPRQEIDVSVNSTAIGELTYSRENAEGLRSIRVPRELLVGHHGLVVIRFRFKNEVSPAHLGLSADSRDLALWLKAFALRPSENSLVPKPNSGLGGGGSE